MKHRERPQVRQQHNDYHGFRSDQLRFVLASDRGPIYLRMVDGVPEVTQRQGSVTTVLDAAAHALGPDLCWFAFAEDGTSTQTQTNDNSSVVLDHLGYHYFPVSIDRHTYREYYEEAGARLLWPALHGLRNEFDELWGVGQAAVNAASFRTAYQSVNRSIALQINGHLGIKTPAILNDYQLATTPAFLRQISPARPIALFMHTPFPDAVSLSQLPTDISASIIRAMLKANLVGFQTRQWADNFMESCEYLNLGVRTSRNELRHSESHVFVAEYPVPPDIASLMASAEKSDVLYWERHLVERAAGRRIVVRIERSDPSKNLLRALKAYELLLNRRPDLQREIHLYVFLVPSRPRVPEYAEYARLVRGEIGRLQGKFPQCLSLFEGHNMDRALAAMRIYDVLFVNSLRDGMNLVAQEGPVVNLRYGAVVVSSEAGASVVLGAGAVPIANPYDVVRTCDALEEALGMPALERQHRAKIMRDRVSLCKPERWLGRQLTDLLAIRGSK